MNDRRRFPKGFPLLPGRLPAATDYGRARAAVLGLPLDFTSTYRPGSRFAPARIRDVWVALDEYSPALDRPFADASFFDCGDVSLGLAGLDEAMRLAGEAVAAIVDDGKVPVCLGGEHLITPLVLAEVARRHPSPVLVQFDAHADLRLEYSGRRHSHACAVRRVADFLNPRDIYQLGVRSLTREEREFAAANTNLLAGDLRNGARAAREAAGHRPVYLSVDIDVVDPAFAPGTGTPVPGGPDSRELLEAISLLRGARLVGADIVEVCPPFDVADITLLLAATLLREILLLL